MRNSLLGLITVGTLFAPASFAATCGAPRALAVTGFQMKYSSILIDNDSIRITDFHPSEGSTGGERSPWPSLIIEDTQRPGQIAAIRDFKSSWLPAGATLQFDEGKGKDAYHALRIELKKGDCEPVKNPPLPPTDGVTIHDPRIVVPFENPWVRVLEIEVKPGDSEPPHTHTWPSVVYYYRLPTSRRGSFDGKPPVDRPELTKQQVTFENFPAEMHTLLNTGNYLYQAHRIEIKPVTDQLAKK